MYELKCTYTERIPHRRNKTPREVLIKSLVLLIMDIRGYIVWGYDNRQNQHVETMINVTITCSEHQLLKDLIGMKAIVVNITIFIEQLFYVTYIIG